VATRDKDDELLPPFLRALVPHRFLILAVWDCLAWVAALWLSAWVRYEFKFENVDSGELLKSVPFVVGIQLLAGVWQGLYKGRWHLGSFEEIAGLLRSVAAAMVVLFFVNLPVRWIPISVPVIASFVVLVGMAGLRYAWRLAIERRKRPTGEGAARALVFGAGEGASQLLTATLRDPGSP